LIDGCVGSQTNSLIIIDAANNDEDDKEHDYNDDGDIDGDNENDDDTKCQNNNVQPME